VKQWDRNTQKEVRRVLKQLCIELKNRSGSTKASSYWLLQMSGLPSTIQTSLGFGIVVLRNVLFFTVHQRVLENGAVCAVQYEAMHQLGIAMCGAQAHCGMMIPHGNADHLTSTLDSTDCFALFAMNSKICAHKIVLIQNGALALVQKRLWIAKDIKGLKQELDSKIYEAIYAENGLQNVKKMMDFRRCLRVILSQIANPLAGETIVQRYVLCDELLRNDVLVQVVDEVVKQVQAVPNPKDVLRKNRRRKRAMVLGLLLWCGMGVLYAVQNYWEQYWVALDNKNRDKQQAYLDSVWQQAVADTIQWAPIVQHTIPGFTKAWSDSFALHWLKICKTHNGQELLAQCADSIYAIKQDSVYSLYQKQPVVQLQTPLEYLAYLQNWANSPQLQALVSAEAASPVTVQAVRVLVLAIQLALREGAGEKEILALYDFWDSSMGEILLGLENQKWLTTIRQNTLQSILKHWAVYDEQQYAVLRREYIKQLGAKYPFAAHATQGVHHDDLQAFFKPEVGTWATIWNSMRTVQMVQNSGGQGQEADKDRAGQDELQEYAPFPKLLPAKLGDVYAPVNTKALQELNQFYARVHSLLQTDGNPKVVFFDFCARVTEKHTQDIFFTWKQKKVSIPVHSNRLLWREQWPPVGVLNTATVWSQLADYVQYTQNGGDTLKMIQKPYLHTVVITAKINGVAEPNPLLYFNGQQQNWPQKITTIPKGTHEKI
jgi:hypothetical protein